MLREEQIKQQADKYIGHSEYFGEDINTIIERIAFIEGAKWADANPNLSEEEQVGMGELGMIWKKKALIKKSCE